MVGTDRGALQVATDHAGRASTLVGLPATFLAEWSTWRDSDRISFVLSPGTATAIIATGEYATLEASCASEIGRAHV